MEERKAKITPSKQDKKSATTVSSKLKTKETIGKEKEKSSNPEPEVLTPRGGTSQSHKSDNLSTNSHPSPLINKSVEISRPGAELQARFENKMENAAQKPEIDNLDQCNTGSSNANTSSLQLSGQESNASANSNGPGHISKPKKKELAKGSPSQIQKAAPSSTVKITKKVTPTLGERPSNRASTSIESMKKEKTPRTIPEKGNKLKRDRNSETLNANSAINISVNSSTESPPKASTNQDNINNMENIENSPRNHTEHRDSVDNRKYSVEIEVNEEENESGSHERANITQYYKQKKGRINVWTYLFKNLYRAIGELITMCDIEQKVEFNNGVISTLESAIEDFQKMSHKFELDKVVSLKDKAKPLAWDISSNVNELTNHDELENCFDDLEDPDTVNFNLLTDLVREVNEAMILIIRERAFLAEEQGTNPLSNVADHKNSFISCGASEIFFDYNNAKEPKDDSAILPDPFSSSATARRSRSVTPGRISLTRLANRINWKLANLYSNDEDDENHIERLRNKSEQKQAKAELIRKDLESTRKEFFLREKEKQAEVRERLEEKKIKFVQKHARKLDEAQERYEARIQSIRKKAKNESVKVHEIAFITLLENQNKRLSLDEKLSDTRERRTKILDNIKKKQMERNLKEAEVNKRREQKKQENLQKIIKSRTKIELAEERREKMYILHNFSTLLKQISQPVYKVERSNT